MKLLRAFLRRRARAWGGESLPRNDYRLKLIASQKEKVNCETVSNPAETSPLFVRGLACGVARVDCVATACGASGRHRSAGLRGRSNAKHRALDARELPSHGARNVCIE